MNTTSVGIERVIITADGVDRVVIWPYDWIEGDGGSSIIDNGLAVR